MESVTRGGVTVPAVGLGTWGLRGDRCRRTVRDALAMGYRHIDTAQAYGNERAVGAAIVRSDVPREDVFLTTKLAPSNVAPDDVRPSVEASLARLDTDYVDLLLVHRPSMRVPVGGTLDAMADLVDEGLVRHVGVSNFDIDRLDTARRHARVPLLTNQVQFHPWWDQTALLDYCDIHDIALTAYSPLAHGAMLDDPVCREVAAVHGTTPAQVAIRWCIQHDGVVAIPKATGRDHLAANLDVVDFTLSDAEMARLARPSRLRTLAGVAAAWLSG